MRLRQLGAEQSVVFFAPPEVDRSIRDVCNLKSYLPVNSAHCVRWLLEMTCRANEQLRPLHQAQGIDFCRRTNAEWENPRFLVLQSQRNDFLRVIQQKENQSLKELYGVKSEKAPPIKIGNPQMREFLAKLAKQRTGSDGKEILMQSQQSSAFEEVEQEREVEFQVEEVREAQKPTHYRPLSFRGFNENIWNFCLTGVLKGERGYRQVFAALAETALGKLHQIQATNSRLFVSEEFTRTIHLIDENKTIDEFFVSFPHSLLNLKEENS